MDDWEILKEYPKSTPSERAWKTQFLMVLFSVVVLIVVLLSLPLMLSLTLKVDDYYKTSSEITIREKFISITSDGFFSSTSQYNVVDTNGTVYISSIEYYARFGVSKTYKVVIDNNRNWLIEQEPPRVSIVEEITS